MVTVEIIVRSDGKTIASNLLRISKNAVGHSIDIPVQPVVIQEAEYAHDEQLTLHGLRATVEGVVSSNKGSGMVATDSSLEYQRVKSATPAHQEGSK